MLRLRSCKQRHLKCDRERTGRVGARAVTRRLSSWELVPPGTLESVWTELLYPLTTTVYLILPNMSQNARKSFMRNWYAVEVCLSTLTSRCVALTLVDLKATPM